MPLIRQCLCPHCHGFEKGWAAIRWYELPLLIVLVRPYRCSVCFRRTLHFML